MQLRVGLEGLAYETFQQLFECMLKTTVQESLAGADDEEDCDEDEYSTLGTMASLLGPISTVGRANFAAALSHVCASLAATMGDAERVCQAASAPGGGDAAATQRDAVRVLEGLRVGVLFLSHLCVDEFRGDTGGGGRDGGDAGSSDTPTMPPVVVDAFAVGAGGGARGDAGAGLREAVAVAARVLQFQMAALTQVTPNLSHHRHTAFRMLHVSPRRQLSHMRPRLCFWVVMAACAPVAVPAAAPRGAAVLRRVQRALRRPRPLLVQPCRGPRGPSGNTLHPPHRVHTPLPNVASPVCCGRF